MKAKNKEGTTDSGDDYDHRSDYDSESNFDDKEDSDKDEEDKSISYLARRLSQECL
jgi:hypothetical protein